MATEKNTDILRIISDMKERVDDIEKQVKTSCNDQAVLNANVEALQNSFTSLKGEVINTLKEHTDKTWLLMDKLVKVIIVLVAVICLMSGVKIGADILKSFI